MQVGTPNATPGWRTAPEPLENRASVTSLTSPDTVLNDRTIKPAQYAKAGVRLYLLVDQELGRWTLFGLAEGWQRYQVAADGAYGEEVNLPAPLNFSLTTEGWPRWK
jgi:Uma2 family endonuclease